MEDKHAPEPKVGSARCQQAYVLRMWNADQCWQASLQDVKTSQRIGFASLVPLLWIVTDPAQAQTSPVIEFTRGWADAVGLPLTVGTLVVFFVCTLIVRSLLTLVAIPVIYTWFDDLQAFVRRATDRLFGRATDRGASEIGIVKVE